MGINLAWVPIGPGDPDCIWIENEDERIERENNEKLEDTDTPIETEEDKENETDKENK